MTGGTRNARAAVLVVASIGALVAIRATTGSREPDVARPPVPTTTGSEGVCAMPAGVAMPAWYPDDLPLPHGSFATGAEEGANGIRAVTLVVRDGFEETLGAFERGLDAEGWNLGAGEREPWEAENVFWKPDDRYGRYRISLTCSPRDWTIVSVALTEDTAG